jgi:hypothetical protein
MKRLVAGVLIVTTWGCFAPPGAQQGPTSMLVPPGGSPPPTTANAGMPPSLPPPPAAASLVQRNALYGTGLTVLGIGGGSLGAGIIFAVLGATVIPCKLGDSSCPTQADVTDAKNVSNAFIGVGVAAIVVGVIAIGISIPLLIAGANQVRRQMGYAYLGPDGAGFRF